MMEEVIKRSVTRCLRLSSLMMTILGLSLCYVGVWIIEKQVKSELNIVKMFRVDGVDRSCIRSPWGNYGWVTVGREISYRNVLRILNDFIAVTGCLNVMASLFLVYNPEPYLSYPCCMALNYITMLYLGMSLSLGACSQFSSHPVALYFLALGLMFGLLIALILVISLSIIHHRNNNSCREGANLICSLEN